MSCATAPSASPDLSTLLWTRGGYETTDLEKVYTGNDRRLDLLLKVLRDRVLVEAARQLGDGNGVAILPYSHELTTQQAADLLNVSRPHLVTLVEGGAISFHKAGTHRRIYLKDLLEYKHRRDSERRSALQAMVDEAQETGIYAE